MVVVVVIISNVIIIGVGIITVLSVLSLLLFGRGDDTVENPHRAQISPFELFELIPVLKLDKEFPVEQFEAAVSQSTAPSPPLRLVQHYIYIYIYNSYIITYNSYIITVIL